MNYETLYFIASIAFVPIAISAIIGWWKFNAHSQEKWIVILTSIACISELISSALWRNEMNNILVSHCYTVIEFAFLTYYFCGYYSFHLRKWSLFTSVAFAGFVIVEVFLFNDPYQMNWVPRTIESIIMILMALFTYGFILKNSTDTDVWKQPLFWINSAVLLYFSSNLLLFYFSSYVASLSHSLNISIWLFHVLFMTLYYFLISIGLWKTPQIQHS